MIIKLIKERKARKEREKVYKGLLKMKEYIDEMRASGKYSDETLRNADCWFASACSEYAKMF